MKTLFLAAFAALTLTVGVAQLAQAQTYANQAGQNQSATEGATIGSHYVGGGD